MKYSNSKYAARYAKAVFGLACEKNILEKINADMEALGATIAENPVLIKILTSFYASNEKRRAVIEEIADKGKFHKDLKNLLLLAIKNKRGALLPVIAEEFREMYREYNNIATIDVVSAEKLNDADKKRITEEIKKKAGFESLINAEVDETLIAGFVITYKSRRHDDSLKTKLERLKKTMKGTA